MKKIIISAVLALGALSLFGCHTSAMNYEQPLQAMQQSFSGIVPCADCSGIETSLFLQQDGTYVLQETYLGAKNGDLVFASYGSWARTADKLVLTDSKGEKRYFHPEGDNLAMLDASGSPIVSQFNYVLKPTTQVMPNTPMSLSGMMQSSAGAVTFTDCVTGKVFPLSGNKALEQGYLTARKKPQELVFVSMDGHFTVESPTGEQQPKKSLVVDSNVKFDASKACP